MFGSGNCVGTNQVAGARIPAMTRLGRRFWLGRRQGKGGKGLETLVIACSHIPKGVWGGGGGGNNNNRMMCAAGARGNECDEWRCHGTGGNV